MPSILSTRQAYQWINRIAQKHKQLSSLTLSPEQDRELQKRIELDFIDALLTLEDANVTRQDVIRALAASEGFAETAKPALRDVLAAFRFLKASVQNQKPNARLDVQLLLRLHAPNGNGAFRKGPIAGSTIGPEHLPIIVEQACRWFASRSIEELNPVEQAAIAFLRFVEIAPFEQHNERTALMAASLLTLRHELPPIIINLERKADYYGALNEGLQMNTRPMVELVAAAVEQSLDEMLTSVGP